MSKIMEMKVYYVSKSGKTPAVLNALMQAGIYTRKFGFSQPGCIAVPLTEEETEKLQALGCVVTESQYKPQPQLIPLCISNQP